MLRSSASDPSSREETLNSLLEQAKESRTELEKVFGFRFLVRKNIVQNYI